MTNALSGKGIYGFGIEPLLDLPWDDPEDAWDFVEHVRMHGTVPTDTEGSVLGTDSSYNNRRDWYNPAWGECERAHKFTYEEWVNSKQERKNKERYDLIKHWKELKAQKDYDEAFERTEYERAMAAQSHGLRGWAKQQEAQTPKQREAKQVENERAERDREHERQKAWALAASAMERRITEIADGVDCGTADRTMIRSMLRYMNLGPGQGQKWDAQKFVQHYSPTWRGSLIQMTLNDVERCYNLLERQYQWPVR